MDPVTVALLTRILNDPSFRSWLQNDPAAALADAGVTVSLTSIPSPISLPSDDEIRAILALVPAWDLIQGCLSPLNVVGWQKP